MFDRIHLWSHLVLDFCLLGVFKSQFQLQCLWMVCLYFLFLPGSVLGDCTFLRICPFLLDCPFYWHIIACVSVVSIVTSPFSFLILLILALSLFFLMSLAKFCLSFQRTSFWFHWSFLLFSSSLFHLFVLWSLGFLSFY